MSRYRYSATAAAILLGVILSADCRGSTSFEFFVVSGSSKDVPISLVGTSELEDSRNIQICDRLMNDDSLIALAAQLQLPVAEVRARISVLNQEELLRHKADDSFGPTFPIIRQADADWFARIDSSVVDATVHAIKARQKELRARFRELLHLDASQERDLSLILFGDTLFDRWQTRYVRERFLPGYPPPRAGKLFFLAGLEKVDGPVASLGIYTHSEPRYGNVTVVSYGHTKIIDPFAQLNPKEIPKLIQSYLRFVRGRSRATVDLRRLGLAHSGKPTVAIVPQSAYAKLPEITNSFSATLLELLNAERQRIVAAHEASRYFPGVSFQEFALWWYHFFDAAVVDKLIIEGVISVPRPGYATMIVVPD